MLRKKRVCFDFGHGGSDPGAIGLGFIQEKDLVYEIGLITATILQAMGVDLVFTRTSDNYVTLKSRCDISNNSESNLFVSLHCNAFNKPTAQGVEVFHYPGSRKGKKISEIILNGILESGLYTANRGVKTSSKFYVLKGTKAPAALIELGFITNYQDLKLIQENKFNLAKVLASSIEKCL